MRSQIQIYDDEYRCAVEEMSESAIVLILDDYRAMMKDWARLGRNEWADMCERRAQILLDELNRQYETRSWQCG